MIDQPGSPGGPSPEAHDEEVDALARATAELPAEYADDPRTAAALARLQDRWRSTRVPVVISGEVSTGKSELVNGLVGERVLPTDTAACTSVWVRVSHQPRFLAQARVRAEDVVTRRIPREDLGVYLTVAGEKVLRRRHGKEARVESVDIGVPSRLLEPGLELLDTPGVGGLTAAHRRAALTGLAEADAVVFVTKPGQPISASERQFLADAVEHVSVCLVVSTHRDTVLDADAALAQDLAVLRDVEQWTALLEDAGRARALASRFERVPAVAVSAKNRLAAGELPPGPGRDDLEAASGMTVLEDLLRREVSDRVGLIHRRNLLHLCSLHAGEVAGTAIARAGLLRGDARAEEALAERERVIARWSENGADHWRKEFENTCNAVGVEFATRAQERSGDLGRLRSRLSNMDRGEVDAAVEEIRRAPEELLFELLSTGQSAMEEAVGRVRGLLAEDGLDGPLSALVETRAVEGRLPSTTLETGIDLGDVRTGVAGGIAAVAVTHFGGVLLANAGLVAVAANPIFWPFAVGGLAFGGYSWWQRHTRRSVNQAVELVDAVRPVLTGDVVTQATEAFTTAAHTVRDEIVAALEDQRKKVAADRRVRAEALELDRHPEQREARLAELTTLADRASDLRERARTLRDALGDAG